MVIEATAMNCVDDISLNDCNTNDCLINLYQNSTNDNLRLHRNNNNYNTNHLSRNKNNSTTKVFDNNIDNTYRQNEDLVDLINEDTLYDNVEVDEINLEIQTENECYSEDKLIENEDRSFDIDLMDIIHCESLNDNDTIDEHNKFEGHRDEIARHKSAPSENYYHHLISRNNIDDEDSDIDINDLYIKSDSNLNKIKYLKQNKPTISKYGRFKEHKYVQQHVPYVIDPYDLERKDIEWKLTYSDGYNDDYMYNSDDDEPIVQGYNNSNIPWMDNVLLNHPDMNTKNPFYKQNFKRVMLYNQCFNINHDDDGNEIDFSYKFPLKMVDIKFLNPTNPSETIARTAVADTGSDIEAIGIGPTKYYKNKGLVKIASPGNEVVVTTGNGKRLCREYVPVKVLNAKGKQIQTKFWCLPLQNIDWLIGNRLLYQLGWQLVNKFVEWKHDPSPMDEADEGLDDLHCVNYPLYQQEPEIDVTPLIKNNCSDPILSEFLCNKMKEYQQHIAAKHEWDSGTIINRRFGIDLMDEHVNDTFTSKEYYMTPVYKEEVKRQLKGMEENGLIEKIKGNTRFISSIFCVAKKTGDIRIVYDYRKLNAITKMIQWPMPRIDDLRQKFKGKKYITTLDLKGGYWHIPIKEEDRNKTAFIFDGVVYRWNFLPFGLMNAVMFFQQCMKQIFHEVRDYTLVYLDDISIISDTLEEHIEHVTRVLDIIKDNNIKIRIDKCLWGVSDTEYLGYLIDKDGTKPKPVHLEKLYNVPEPRNKKNLRRFIGLTQWLHDFIPAMHIPLSVLTPLTPKNAKNKFVMNDQQRNAFNELKELAMNSDYLMHPDPTKEFHLFTDASKYGIGGMIAQRNNDGNFQPISYCSKIFNKTQQNWHVSEQEIYAIVYCIERWEKY